MKTMKAGAFYGWNSEHPQLEKIGFVHQNMGTERKGVPNKGVSNYHNVSFKVTNMGVENRPINT